MLEHYISHRAKIGVIIPSTNTAVEYDLQKLLPRGLTWLQCHVFVSSTCTVFCHCPRRDPPKITTSLPMSDAV